MNVPVSRRSLLRAGGVTLGAAVVPIGAAMPLADGVPVTGLAAPVPLTFDRSAFVADLKTAGYVVVAYRAVPRGGEHAEPPCNLIRPPKERGLGALPTVVMDKGWDAMAACPDHVERVAAHVFGQIGRTA